MGHQYSFKDENIISLKTPGHEKAGLEDFNGMCHGAGGCAPMVAVKTDLDKADRGCDMDAACGYQRRPGTAGAHPTMRQARTAEDYAFMKKQAGSLVPPVLSQETD